MSPPSLHSLLPVYDRRDNRWNIFSSLPQKKNRWVLSSSLHSLSTREKNRRMEPTASSFSSLISHSDLPLPALISTSFYALPLAPPPITPPSISPAPHQRPLTECLWGLIMQQPPLPLISGCHTLAAARASLYDPLLLIGLGGAPSRHFPLWTSASRMTRRQGAVPGESGDSATRKEWMRQWTRLGILSDWRSGVSRVGGSRKGLPLSCRPSLKEVHVSAEDDRVRHDVMRIFFFFVFSFLPRIE